jgi:hypothetical protein
MGGQMFAFAADAHTMGTERSLVRHMSDSVPPTIVVPAAPKTPEKKRPI